jgi:lipopolysaccharide/colanic/teichoic acid biosynthesis glycosyltransferase
LLFACAGFDLLGLFLALVLINLRHEPDLLNPPWLVFGLGGIYCGFAWLLGSYTLLRWPWLRLRLVLQRLSLTALATLVGSIVLGWALAFDGGRYSLLNREVLLEVMAWQMLLALLIRLQLRWISRSQVKPLWQLMAAPEHQRDVLREWQRNPFVRPPNLVSPSEPVPNQRSTSTWRRPMALALAHGLQLDERQRSQIMSLRSRGVTVTTLEELAERQLERLPPSLLPENWLTLNELPWANEFSLQRKIKRTADVILAGPLLLLSTPILILLAFAITLEDGGPVFYVQRRTGWMGRTFPVFKLRTMRNVLQTSNNTYWTTHADPRVTRVGAWLRRTRLDELPQLFNVLRGEMSLIGPRPEQPHLDDQLAEQIPHYRKRYWMLPGLSGWAQVCGPAYPASLEEAELKLSYDLYYLRNWNNSLDLLILAKTIKTLLKLRGV